MKNLSSPIALIRKSFEIFFDKDNLQNLMKIYAWLLPFQAFFLYQNYYISMQSQVLNETNATLILARNPAFFAVVLLINIAFFVVSFLVEMAAIKSLIHITGGKSVNLKEIFFTARSRVLRFFGLSVLLWAIITLGILFLIIPGLIFAAWFAFAKFVFVDKETKVIESLDKSRALLKGKFWAVAGRLFIFLVFGILVQVVFAMVPYGIGTLVGTLFGALIILPAFLLYKEVSS